MNLKPSIKVLKLFILEAVSISTASWTDLPQGLSEPKASSRSPSAGAALGQELMGALGSPGCSSREQAAVKRDVINGFVQKLSASQNLQGLREK